MKNLKLVFKLLYKLIEHCIYLNTKIYNIFTFSCSFSVFFLSWYMDFCIATDNIIYFYLIFIKLIIIILLLLLIWKLIKYKKINNIYWKIYNIISFLLSIQVILYIFDINFMEFIQYNIINLIINILFVLKLKFGKTIIQNRLILFPNLNLVSLFIFILLSFIIYFMKSNNNLNYYFRKYLYNFYFNIIRNHIWFFNFSNF